jgi:hypothetical protein
MLAVVRGDEEARERLYAAATAKPRQMPGHLDEVALCLLAGRWAIRL